MTKSTLRNYLAWVMAGIVTAFKHSATAGPPLGATTIEKTNYGQCKTTGQVTNLNMIGGFSTSTLMRSNPQTSPRQEVAGLLISTFGIDRVVRAINEISSTTGIARVIDTLRCTIGNINAMAGRMLNDVIDTTNDVLGRGRFANFTLASARTH